MLTIFFSNSKHIHILGTFITAYSCSYYTAIIHTPHLDGLGPNHGSVSCPCSGEVQDQSTDLLIGKQPILPPQPKPAVCSLSTNESMGDRCCLTWWVLIMLQHSNVRVIIWHEHNQSMDSFCLVSVVQTGDGSVSLWGHSSLCRCFQHLEESVPVGIM